MRAAVEEGVNWTGADPVATKTRRKSSNTWRVVLLAGLACSSCSARSLDYLTSGTRRGDANFFDASPDGGAGDDLVAQEDEGAEDALESLPPGSRSDAPGGEVASARLDASSSDVARDLAGDSCCSGADLASRDAPEDAEVFARGDLAAESPADSKISVDSAEVGMVYGVVGQSCGSGLACPGGSSCCSQVEVPACDFVMGTSSDPSRGDDEQPEHAATISAFWLDVYEVTVGRFRKFVLAFDGTLPPPNSGNVSGTPGSGWLPDYDQHLPSSKTALIDQVSCSSLYQTWTTAAGARDSMPMNCISWYVALTFCIWDGGRLPTEAEWEDAASNGASHTRFPWGSADPDPAKHAVMNCLGDGAAGCAPTDLLPVGSRPAGASHFGHLDLAGELDEWTMDYYDPTYYGSVGVCDDCVDVAASTTRVLRGGDFTSPAALVRSTKRADAAPNQVNPYTGFRCARPL